MVTSAQSLPLCHRAISSELLPPRLRFRHEPPPADIESTNAVPTQRQGRNGRMAHAFDALNATESGAPHPRIHCLPSGIRIPAVFL